MANGVKAPRSTFHVFSPKCLCDSTHIDSTREIQDRFTSFSSFGKMRPSIMSPQSPSLFLNQNAHLHPRSCPACLCRRCGGARVAVSRLRQVTFFVWGGWRGVCKN